MFWYQVRNSPCGKFEQWIQKNSQLCKFKWNTSCQRLLLAAAVAWLFRIRCLSSIMATPCGRHPIPNQSVLWSKKCISYSRHFNSLIAKFIPQSTSKHEDRPLWQLKYVYHGYLLARYNFVSLSQDEVGVQPTTRFSIQYDLVWLKLNTRMKWKQLVCDMK